MNIESIIMIGAVVIANIGTTVILFTWATSRADYQLKSANDRSDRLLEGIALEMKDFHAKLCKIEASSKNVTI